LPLGNFGRTQEKKGFLLCKKGVIKTKWRGGDGGEKSSAGMAKLY
jgi:hypothetical protein